VTDFPTARTMLPNDSWLCVFVWCKACHHQAPADLQAIIDAGRGDVPVKDLSFRCTSCSSALTDFVVMSRDALGVQPWRADDDSTSGAAGHLRGQRPWR
jgi:hypothetical protein